MSSRFLSLLLLLLSFVTSVQAQQSHMETVLCELTDHEGNRWYGTQGGGLLRDDGHNVEVFRSDRNHPDLLGSNDVTCLAECTAQGEIWFGTKRGAYTLTMSDHSIRPLLPDELGDMRLNCMMESSKGTMWVAYRNHLLELSARDKSILRRFELTWKGKNRGVVALTEDRHKTIWLALWNGGICRLTKGSDHFEPCPWERDDYCTELRFDSMQNCIILQTSTDTTLMLRQGAVQVEPYVDVPQMLTDILVAHGRRNDGPVLSWAQANDSSYYIGTYHTLYAYDAPIDSLHIVADNTDRVRAMQLATDGTLFFLCKSMGVCRLRTDSVAVLLNDDRFRSLELLSCDSILALTDGVGNTARLNLLTGELTEAELPQDKASNSLWGWLLVLAILIGILGGVVVWKVRKKRDEQPDSAAKEQAEPEPAVEPQEESLGVADREFLTRAQEVVETHLSDPNYSVDAFASDMFMSRAALYRRLRQSCGQTPTDFLRNQRLDRAAHLLRTTSSSVNEVSDLVGFSYASYFTRCFKERFGVAPKDFR